MIIGVPKEIKPAERRVGMTPSSVRELIAHGHDVVVETNAGGGIGASDDDYLAVGASIAAGADQVFDEATLIVKVKEPQP
ncbi:MAG: alanine dehydrogenase, partial [Actinomycetota bacterium]